MSHHRGPEAGLPHEATRAAMRRPRVRHVERVMLGLRTAPTACKAHTSRCSTVWCPGLLMRCAGRAAMARIRNMG